MLAQDLILLLIIIVGISKADYDCLCNYNIDLKIHAAPDVQSTVIGRMYEFDCKPSLSSVKNTSRFMAIQFEKKVGYLQPNEQVQKQICSGQPSPDDLVSTTVTPTITTSASTDSPKSTVTVKPYTSSRRPTTVLRITSKMPIKTTTRMSLKTTTKSPMQTTTRTPIKRSTIVMTHPVKTTMKTTRRFTTTTKTTSSVVPVTSSATKTTTSNTDTPYSGIVKDRIEVCPDHIKTDAAQKGGFLGQYGDFCLEVVDWQRPFDAAESHCRITSGHLIAITNQDEQDYVTGLLAKHNYINSSWIGLNDKSGEGTYQWTSGTPFSFNNMRDDFNQHTAKDHKLNDCFVIMQGGEWTDLPCGVSLTFLGLGEQHPFICQYNVSAKVQSLFEIIPQVIG